jgi:hypothetical protein
MNGLSPLGFCVIAVLFFQTFGWCQSQTYVGLEAALYEDQNSIGEDSGGSLNTVSAKGLLGGLTIRRDLNPRWFVESGIIYKMFYQSIVFDLPVNYPYTLYGFMSLQVPFRLGYRIRLNDKMSFILLPGISMGFNIEPDYASFGGATTINSKTYKYYAKGTHDNRFFILVNPSLALERVLFDSWIISLYAGRSWGLTDISELIVDYTIDNSSTYTGTIINNGNFFYGGISLKYPIGRPEKK